LSRATASRITVRLTAEAAHHRVLARQALAGTELAGADLLGEALEQLVGEAARRPQGRKAERSVSLEARMSLLPWRRAEVRFGGRTGGYSGCLVIVQAQRATPTTGLRPGRPATRASTRLRTQSATQGESSCFANAKYSSS